MILAGPAAVLAGVLAQTPPPGTPGAGRGEEFGKTSPLALVVILLLGIATVLLIRSMNKRLRNVPTSFDRPDETDEPAGDDDHHDEPEQQRNRDDHDGRGEDGGRPDRPRAADQSPEGASGLGHADGPPRAGSP